MTSSKKIVVALIAGFLTLGILSWLPAPDAKDIVRFLISCVLCWFLYRGANWARWVMGVLAAIGCVAATIYVVKLPAEPIAIAVLSIMLVFYGIAAFLLLSGKHVESHFSATNT